MSHPNNPCIFILWTPRTFCLLSSSPLFLTFTSFLFNSSDQRPKVTEISSEHISPTTRHLQQLTHTVPPTNTHTEYLHSMSTKYLWGTPYVILRPTVGHYNRGLWPSSSRARKEARVSEWESAASSGAPSRVPDSVNCSQYAIDSTVLIESEYQLWSRGVEDYADTHVAAWYREWTNHVFDEAQASLEVAFARCLDAAWAVNDED